VIGETVNSHESDPVTVTWICVEIDYCASRSRFSTEEAERVREFAENRSPLLIVEEPAFAKLCQEAD
jgi:hypothetical protein